MTALNELSAVEAAAGIAAGKFKSEDLVKACLARIKEREPKVGAWAAIDPKKALAAARKRDGEKPRGPLHGVPIGVKDIIDTAEFPTGYGSELYTGYKPPWNATAVALAERAGAVILGKTVTTEFAYFRPGKTANPRNLKHTPGGSSSGSAAAVADNMVPLAFGSQTAASITRPAAFCGVVGYKPTYGTLPLVGIKPFATSLDTLGTLTRSVEDAALLVSALLGIAWEGPRKPSRAPRIGICRTPWWSEADPAAKTAMETAAAKLAKGGAKLAEVRLPAEYGEMVELQKIVMAYEADKDYAYEYDVGGDRISPQIRQLIEQGRAISRGDYLTALSKATVARQKLAGVFKRLDAIMAPSAKGEAPEGLGATGDPVFSRGWTLLRLPTVALPVGVGPKGLPIGIQLLGAMGEDPKLLRLSSWAEERLK